MTVGRNEGGLYPSVDANSWLMMILSDEYKSFINYWQWIKKSRKKHLNRLPICAKETEVPILVHLILDRQIETDRAVDKFINIFKLARPIHWCDFMISFSW